MLRLMLLVGALSALAGRRATAQAAAVSWPPLNGSSTSSLYAHRPAAPLAPRSLAGETPDTVPKQIRPTHWKEGGIVGALALGALGIWLGNEICQETEAGDDSGCTAKAIVGGGIGGGGIGFLIGALIGGQFPKHSPTQTDQTSAAPSGNQ